MLPCVKYCAFRPTPRSGICFSSGRTRFAVIAGGAGGQSGGANGASGSEESESDRRERAIQSMRGRVKIRRKVSFRSAGVTWHTIGRNGGSRGGPGTVCANDDAVYETLWDKYKDEWESKCVLNM